MLSRLAVVVLLVATASCSGGDGGCWADTRPQLPLAAYDAADANYFDSFRYGATVDYNPVRSPGELGAKTEVVVLGRVRRAVNGRVEKQFPGDERGSAYFVIHLQVDSVLKGCLHPRSGGMVYVDWIPQFPGQVPSDAAGILSRAIPKDVPIVLYASERPDDSLPELPQSRRGRPAGQPLLSAAPQGFLFGYADRTVDVLGTGEHPGTRLDQFLPHNDRFPYDPFATSPMPGGTSEHR